MPTSRRNFLTASALAAGASLTPSSFASYLVRREPPRKLSILVFGGTGLIGPKVVQAALDRGHSVTLFNRGRTRTHLFPDLEKIQGNRDPEKHAIEDDPSTPKGLEGLKGRTFDAVLDDTGYYPRIVRAAAELLAPNVKQYVFISSTSAYARNDTPGADVDSELATVEDPSVETMGTQYQNYGGFKVMCEQAVQDVYKERATIIRPGLIVGPGDATGRWLYWPVRLSEGGEMLAPGDGDDRIQVIDVRDLAAFMITCVENQTGGVFNAIGPEGGMTVRNMLAECGKAVNSDAKLVWVPADFLEKWSVSPWGDMPAWIPSDGEYAGAGQRSIRRSLAAGMKIRPIGETAADALAWYQGLTELTPEQKARLRGPFTREREAQVLAAWKEASNGGGVR